MNLIEQIKADREAGARGPWSAFSGSETHTNIVAVVPHTQCVFSLPGHYKDEANVKRIARVPDMEAALIAADELARSIEELIDESKGVYGLHLNGDVAPWADLIEGGRFEEWLLALAAFRAAVGDTE